MRQEQRSPRRSAAGFTATECLILLAIAGIVAAIAVPWLMRARIARNEASATASLRRILTAEIAYASACGRDSYTTQLAALGVPPPGSTHAFLAGDLAASEPTTDGYTFALRPGAYATRGPDDCHGRPTQTAFYVSATPASPGRTGTLAFAANTTGTIWQLAGALPPAEPFLPPAAPVR